MTRTILISLIALSACGGRSAVEVPITQATDYQLSCDQIVAEQQQIASKVNTLRAEDDSAHNSNIAIGVVGALIFWPALFALDTGEAEEQEIKAYKARSEHLNTVAAQRGCFGTSVAQPVAQQPVAPQPVQPVAPQPVYQQPAAPTQSTSACTWNAEKYRYDC